MSSTTKQLDDPLRRGSHDDASSSSSPLISKDDSPASSRRPSLPVTPQRLGRLQPLHSVTVGSPHSSQASPQPLIRVNDEDDDPEEVGALPSHAPLTPLVEESVSATEGMTSERSYGATEPSANARAGDGTASQPDARTAADDNLHTGFRRPRQLSFKKRRASAANNSRRGSSGDGGGGGSVSGVLNRASIAAFGRALPSITSSKDRSRQRDLRRVHTVSINGQALPNERRAGESGIDTSNWERKPRIPSLIPATPSPNSTPIPKLPFIVLCLVCFGEFSSAGVAGPFLFFQIESFNVGGEGEVGYWAGVVASVFFFAQFLTSMLWASAAQKHGRRAVLLVSLLGNSISLAMFGMSTNLRMAISVRLAQGLFNGAVGVAKGAVRDLTDSTNEGRAMAQLGFAWGMGGIVGPLMGGLLCNPVDKFPGLFEGNEFLARNPYVLPCIVVASFTAIGAFLTLFIGPDGGPRTGAIHLPEKADVEHTTSAMGSLGRSAGKRASGHFGGGGADNGPGNSIVSLRPEPGPSDNDRMPRTFTQIVDEETGGPPSPVDSEDEGTIITSRPGTSAFEERRPLFARPRRMSRTTARHRSILGGGSAYGYDGNASSYGGRTNAGAGSGFRGHVLNAQNRVSMLSNNNYAPDFEELGGANRFSVKPRQLSFAERFLLANDDAVLGLSDLWVAAAINNDESYEDEEYDDFGNDYGEDGSRIEEDETEVLEDSFDGSDFDRSDAPGSTGSMAFGHDEPDEDSPLMPRHLPPLNFARRHRLNSSGASSRSRPMMNRAGSGGRIPSVYSNTGVENTPMLSPGLAGVRPMSPSQQRTTDYVGGGVTGGYDPTLAGIPESGSVSGTLRGKANPSPAGHSQYGGANAHQISVVERQPSLFGQLPLGFIAHYALMSLHSSTFDQIFMAYLVTPFKSGGLGLTAAHYAELIAAMAFFQIGSQFYFYPKVGPPQGQLSHLSMMRLGTLLYLPVYVLFSYLRAFLHPSTDIVVMSFMIMFAALRLLANTCAFTSVSILMNATTEPHLVPLANGLAQTTSSAARFIGPLLGGMLWAKGVEGGYELHAWPFDYHLGFWVVGLLGFAGFLHSNLIR